MVLTLAHGASSSLGITRQASVGWSRLRTKFLAGQDRSRVSKQDTEESIGPDRRPRCNPSETLAGIR